MAFVELLSPSDFTRMHHTVPILQTLAAGRRLCSLPAVRHRCAGLTQLTRTQDCLALGAIFAATDTVAVLQVIRPEEAGVLYSLVFGEGVMNDATSVAILRAVQVHPLLHGADTTVAYPDPVIFIRKSTCDTPDCGVLVLLASTFTSREPGSALLRLLWRISWNAAPGAMNRTALQHVRHSAAVHLAEVELQQPKQREP